MHDEGLNKEYEDERGNKTRVLTPSPMPKINFEILRAHKWSKYHLKQAMASAKPHELDE